MHLHAACDQHFVSFTQEGADAAMHTCCIHAAMLCFVLKAHSSGMAMLTVHDQEK